MSQAIQAFTPLPPSYPYQGNPQQQLSAVGAPSSSSMSNGDVIVLSGVIAVTLLGVGTLVAVTQFGTSSAKKPPTSQVPQFVPSPQTAPPPRHEPVIDTIPGFPGFIYRLDGVYRERQIGGLCGMHALNTVLYKLLGKDGVITKKELIEKFGEEIIEKGLNTAKIMQLAQEKGLETKLYDAEDFVGKSITDIEDSKAFIVGEPTSDPSDPFHAVAIVLSEEGFCLSDSDDQDKREIYMGDADKALHDYQIRHNVTACEVVIFHKSVPAQGMGPQRPLHRSGTWRL